jgi:DNA invertase Pin-like site-specific DNA recombinase
MGRLIGYARISTADQDLSLQRDALRGAGCCAEWIFLDTASGAHTTRPGLAACLQALRPGDTLVVWRLDRLGRSMAKLAIMRVTKTWRFADLMPSEPVRIELIACGIRG